jgi:hypothetical protein
VLLIPDHNENQKTDPEGKKSPHRSEQFFKAFEELPETIRSVTAKAKTPSLKVSMRCIS